MRALSNNNTLQELVFQNSKLIPNIFILLAQALIVNSSVKILVLRDQGNIANAGIQALTDALRANHTLEKLTIDRLDMSIEILRFLGEALATNYTVTELNLLESYAVAPHHLTQAHLKIIYKYLERNKRLYPVWSTMREFLQLDRENIGTAFCADNYSFFFEKINMELNNLSSEASAIQLTHSSRLVRIQ